MDAQEQTLNREVDTNKQKYPSIQNQEIRKIAYSDLNCHIYDYFSLYVGDKGLLNTSLQANPFGITNKLNHAKEEELIRNCIEYLNKMQRLDQELLEQKDDAALQQAKILFLSIQKVLFEHFKDTSDLEKYLDKEKVEYSFKILNTLKISRLKDDLEDRFFSYLESEVYDNYSSILKFTRQNYRRYENKVKTEVEKALSEHNINAVITSRMKTIASMHRKVVKKNILFSQVLDTLGLRLLTKNTEDCYKVLSAILKRWPVVNAKVKDYIALPKEDGYQSIHVTILYEDLPVEIQIRSFEMHHYSEYGLHEKYKCDDYLEL